MFLSRLHLIPDSSSSSSSFWTQEFSEIKKMVLSNKKLKQKLREAKAELLSAKSQIPATVISSGTSYSETQESDKSLLASAAQKSKLTKTNKRKRKALSVKKNGDEAEAEAEAVINGDEGNEGIDELADVKKNIKKRKIDDEEKEEKKEKKMKIKKNKKKIRKKKAKAKENKKAKTEIVEAEETFENGNEVSGNHDIQETNHIADNEEKLEDNMKVYVGGIPYYSTEDDIRSFFEACGTITEIDCMKFPESGKFRGIAIITFRTESAAKRALALDGSDMGGLFLKTQPYKPSRNTVKTSGFSPALVEGYNRVYVGNLSWDITEDDLKNFFSNCNIKSLRFGEDKETGEFRGFAHVDFSDSLSLNNALKLDQNVVLGRPVKISAAVPKKDSVKKEESTGGSKLLVPGKDSGVKSGGSKLLVPGKDSGIKSQLTPVVSSWKCFVCGEHGHVSYTCPAKVKESGGEVKSGAPVDGGESQTMPESDAPPADFGGEGNVSGGKIRRRTCYECGERGHLSSSCPKSAPVKESGGESQALVKSGAPVDGGESQIMPKSDAPPANFGGEGNVSGGKIRRRTCYECGERGHLSSSCTKSAPVKESGGESQAIVKSGAPVDGGESQPMPDIAAPADFGGGGENVSGKIRRRTCYECGERGHLSSSCPKTAPVVKESGGESQPKVESSAPAGGGGGESQPMPETAAPADFGSEENLSKAFELFDEMRERGVTCNVVTYNTLIGGLCKQMKVLEAEKLVSQMKRDGLNPNLITYNTLLHGYCTVGKIDKAIRLYNQIKNSGLTPSVFTFNALISGLSKAGESSRVLRLIQEMEDRGISPSNVTYTILIDAFAKSKDMEKAYEILSRMEKANLVADVCTYGVLISGWCSEGNMMEALKLFESMREASLKPNSVIYNTMINGYTKQGNSYRALKMFDEMSERGLVPSVGSYNKTIEVLCKDKKWKEAEILFDNMVRSGLRPSANASEMINQAKTISA